VCCVLAQSLVPSDFDVFHTWLSRLCIDLFMVVLSVTVTFHNVTCYQVATAVVFMISFTRCSCTRQTKASSVDVCGVARNSCYRNGRDCGTSMGNVGEQLGSFRVFFVEVAGACKVSYLIVLHFVYDEVDFYLS
jgi:hypothetical protein